MTGVVAGMGYRMSSYGCRYDTSREDRRCPSNFRMHHGVDIGGERGAQVRSVYWGRVLATYRTGQLAVYGNTVVVEHYFPSIGGSKLTSGALYAHLASIDVEPGESVSLMSPIGRLGASGAKMVPHLHLEVWKTVIKTRGGRPLFNPDKPERADPERFLNLVGLQLADTVVGKREWPKRRHRRG